VVPIFTYRDERKLFAVIGAVIVAALIALIQIEAARSGRPSVVAVVITTVVGGVQTAATVVVNSVRNGVGAVADLPNLKNRTAQLDSENRTLRSENERLREALAQAPDVEGALRTSARNPGSIPALSIGFDPENQTRSATIDKGSRAGVTLDAGVIDENGVVGRVVQIEPFESTVLLAIDPTSKIPAVVQRGRWWGIATGTSTRIQLQYVSQDAPLRVGDLVVTGEGRSFHAGLPLGRIARVIHPEGALYQTAIVEPAVAFGRLSRVVVLAR
jgi:rod shape-determining protein MreC